MVQWEGWAIFDLNVMLYCCLISRLAGKNDVICGANFTDKISGQRFIAFHYQKHFKNNFLQCNNNIKQADTGNVKLLLMSGNSFLEVGAPLPVVLHGKMQQKVILCYSSWT